MDSIKYDPEEFEERWSDLLDDLDRARERAGQRVVKRDERRWYLTEHRAARRRWFYDHVGYILLWTVAAGAWLFALLEWLAHR